MARVDHVPTPEDLSPSANTTHSSRPPTAEAGEGGKPVLSLYAQARAHHSPELIPDNCLLINSLEIKPTVLALIMPIPMKF